MNKKNSFTLIEILVVATIIALLASVASVTYSQFTRQARNTRRATDLEQVRAALEMYRSNNNTYPVGTGWNTLSVLTTPVVYVQSLPQDPKNPASLYYYSGSENDYVIAAQTEDSSTCQTPPGGSNCGEGNGCNYCIGPYGKK